MFACLHTNHQTKCFLQALHNLNWFKRYSQNAFWDDGGYNYCTGLYCMIFQMHHFLSVQNEPTLLYPYDAYNNEYIIPFSGNCR